MGQKGHIIDQKGLKMYEKRQKMEFADLKYLLFSGIFLSGIGAYPPPHYGRTVAPEAILFESPCRANSETKMAKA